MSSMAGVCCICQNNLSFLDAVCPPLIQEQAGFKVCAKCTAKKTLIMGADTMPGFNDAMTYFSEYVKKDNVNPVVKNQIKKWIDEGEAKREQIRKDKENKRIEQEEKSKADRQINEKLDTVKTFTIDSIQNMNVVEYIGVVEGAGASTLFGGEFADYHDVAYRQAYDSIRKRALEWGDDVAIVGMKESVTMSGSGTNIIIVSLVGTVVKINRSIL